MLDPLLLSVWVGGGAPRSCLAWTEVTSFKFTSQEVESNRVHKSSECWTVDSARSQ